MIPKQLTSNTITDRIRSYYVEDTPLSAEDLIYKDRIVTAHSLTLNEASNDGAACAIMMKRFDISERTAYRDILAAKNIFGSLRTPTKEAMRYIITQWATDLFAMAKKTKNMKGMEKAMERITKVIDHVAAQTRARLPTGLLNRAIEEAVDRVAAPMIGGKRFKIYYGTQVGVAPVTIRIFVNDPLRLTKAYGAFLERILRARFGLEGAPLRLKFQERIRPELPGVSEPGHSRSPASRQPPRYAKQHKKSSHGRHAGR